MTPWELIWTGRSQELAYLDDLDPGGWIGATQADVKRYLLQDKNLRQSSVGGRAMPDACVVMMIKDEADIIGLNLRHLYRLGLRRFVILDNNSTDGTSIILHALRDELSDSELVIVDDATIRYTQSEKTTGLMRLAQSFWPDVNWILPIDADEILCAQDGLRTLQDVPRETDVVVLQKVNHYLANDLQHPAGYPENALTRMPRRTHLGSQPPKIALRPSEEATIMQGNHEIRLKSNRRLTYGAGLSFGLYYREFQFRNFEQFKRKIINGGRALLAVERETGRSPGGDHWKAWFEIYEKQGDDGLRAVFRSISIRSEHESVFDPLVIG
jgi:hypothetical protein